MDSLINAAARALAEGNPLAALNRVALRDDAPALALRGIAMAQLDELDRARALLRRATRAFTAEEVVQRARCAIAEAEVAFAMRDLGGSGRALIAARSVLDAHGDALNAAHAGILEARRLLLVGRIDEAETMLGAPPVATLPPATDTLRALVAAGIAMRRLRTADARAALHRAEASARSARIPALEAEVRNATRMLSVPAARRWQNGEQGLLTLAEVEALLASGALVVDACRFALRHGGSTIALAGRPVLFTLARALGEAWPDDVPRAALVARAFRLRLDDESHRARLRVEMGRLRAALRPFADIRATARGYVLAPRCAGDVVVLAPPVDEAHAQVLAMLADGRAWSSSALATALGTSQRSVQRSLEALAAVGKVQWLGRGRARRWTLPSVPGFTTTLLLPPTLATD